MAPAFFERDAGCGSNTAESSRVLSCRLNPSVVAALLVCVNAMGCAASLMLLKGLRSLWSRNYVCVGQPESEEAEIEEETHDESRRESMEPPEPSTLVMHVYVLDVA